MRKASLRKGSFDRQVGGNRKLEHFFPIVKKSSIKEEKVDKKRQQKSVRVEQSLITRWFVRQQSSQNYDNPLLKIDRPVILMIFQYLRLADCVRMSRVCRHLLRCYNGIWDSLDYFEQFDLQRFTTAQLGLIMRKSTLIGHVRQIKKLLFGKSLQHYTQKVRLSVVASHQKGMLSSFQIEPKRNNMAVSLTDDTMIEIFKHSYRSLTIINLNSCHFLTSKTLQQLIKCRNLVNVSFTRNCFIEDQHVVRLVKSCSLIKSLNLNGCTNLSDPSIRAISQLKQLTYLNVGRWQGSMGSLYHLRTTRELSIVLEGSMVNDNELWMLLRGNSIKYLDITGCPLITIDCFKKLIGCQPTSVNTLCMAKTTISEDDMSLVVEITKTKQLVPQPQCIHIKSLITSNILKNDRENYKF